MDASGAAADIVARLKSAGIRATIDERDINPPAVWVKPPVLTFRFGKGWAAGWTLQAVVPDTGRNNSLAALSTLIVAVQNAMGWAMVTATPIALLIPGGAAPLPGYEMTFNERIN
jgi:hypothetical protein